MADVARLAGVSTTTVSFVINDRPGSGIADETRQRVLEAVRQLAYHPNRTAANLRRRRTHVIALHVTHAMLERQSPFALSLLPSLIRAADARHYQVMTFTDPSDGTGRIAELSGQGAADGFVLTDSAVDDPRARFLTDAGIPFASMGRLADDLPPYWVDIDNTTAIRTALDHLKSRGHTDIGFAAPRDEGYWWEERRRAFLDWSAEQGVRAPASWTVRAPLSHLTPRVHALLEDKRPTALLAAGNGAVVHCYRAANSLGLRIGPFGNGDLAIVGFDPELWMLDPTLTTLTLPFDQLAEALLDLIQHQVAGRAAASTGVLVPTSLLVQDSA